MLLQHYFEYFPLKPSRCALCVLRTHQWLQRQEYFHCFSFIYNELLDFQMNYSIRSHVLGVVFLIKNAYFPQILTKSHIHEKQNHNHNGNGLRFTYFPNPKFIKYSKDFRKLLQNFYFKIRYLSVRNRACYVKILAHVKHLIL